MRLRSMIILILASMLFVPTAAVTQSSQQKLLIGLIPEMNIF